MPLTICLDCRRITSEAKRGRCAGCYSASEQRRAAGRANDPHQRVIASKQWAKVRAWVRRRDGGCVIADEDCHGRLEVHHRVKVVDGGAPFDPDNLVTLCRRHHSWAEGEGVRGCPIASDLEPP